MASRAWFGPLTVVWTLHGLKDQFKESQSQTNVIQQWFTIFLQQQTGEKHKMYGPAAEFHVSDNRNECNRLLQLFF